jgi:hypothetical protein
MTTAAAGAIEYDGSCFYGSVAASERGVVRTSQVVVLLAANSLASQTGAQKAFFSTADSNGAITLALGTYEFECKFALSSIAPTGQFGFALGGTAAITQAWTAYATQGAAAAAVGAAQMSFNTAPNTALAGSLTGAYGSAMIKGIIKVTSVGTVIPQISLGIAATPSVAVGSYFKIAPLSGASGTTDVNVGNWS